MAKYVSPTWENNRGPKLNAENLQKLTDALEDGQALSGSGAPTDSTVGAVGQRYLDTSAVPNAVYTCFGEENGVYLWEKNVDGEDMAEKANIDGSYDSMTVGNAGQLVSTVMVNDRAPYISRTAGGSADIGNREYDELTGGTLAWNQLIRDGHFASGTSYWYRGTNDAESQQNTTISAAGGILTVTHNNAGAHGYKWGLSQVLAVPMVPGHKYYVGYDVRVSDPMQVGALLGTQPTNAKIVPEVNEWFAYRNIVECPVATALTFLCFTMYERYGQPVPAGATREYRNMQMMDLTVMFGPVIADRLFNMEHSSGGSGTGTGWFHKLFPKDYYEYNAGELLSVNAGKHITVGFNAYDPDSGTAKLLGGNQYQISGSYTALSYEDVNGNPETVTPDGSGLFTPAENGVLTVTGGNDSDTCVHLVWSGYRNGEYEAFEKHEYPMDAGLTLRGVPKLDGAGELYYDGDRYEADGGVTRRYGIVDMGALTYYEYLDDERGKRFSVGVPGMKKAAGSAPGNIINPRYANYGYNDVMYNRVDKGISVNSVYSTVAICDSKYTDDETYPTAEEKVAALKASLSGVYLVYELDAPTYDTAQSFLNPQVTDDFGTEEYTDAAFDAGDRDVAIPVGHSTNYPANLRDKLQHMPDLAERDGDYIVRQSGRDLSLAPDTTPERITELSESTAERFSKTNRMTVLEWTGDNAYIGTSGATANLDNPTNYEGFRYAVIDCAPGDIFTVNVSGGITPRAWAFVDASGNVLSRANSSNTTPNYRDHVIVAPTGAAKLVLNDRHCELDSYSGIYAGAAIAKAGLMAPPSENGTYALKVTVQNGTATYRWVSE